MNTKHQELEIKKQIKKLIKQNKRRDININNYKDIYKIYINLKKIKSMFDDYVINKYKKLLFLEKKEIYHELENTLVEVWYIQEVIFKENYDDILNLKDSLADYFNIKMPFW